MCQAIGYACSYVWSFSLGRRSKSDGSEGRGQGAMNAKGQGGQVGR